jgi:DNA repair exonuclease SbcCD nuclease subunit
MSGEIGGSVRFIATADLQIGMPLQWLGTAQARFDQSRLDTIATIGRLVDDFEAEAVVVGGDLFDREVVDADDLVRTLDAIRDLPVPVLVLPGNHDSYSPTSVYRQKAFTDSAPDNLTILLDEPVTIGGVEFVGAPLRTRNPDHPTLHRLLDVLAPDGAPRVAIGHGAVTQVVGAHDDPAAFDLDVIEAALADGRAAFVVLGDRHSTLSVGGTGRVWYPGAPEPTRFGDDAGHVLLVDLPLDDPTAVTVETRQTGTWRFVELEPELTEAEDVDALLGELDAMKQKTLVNLKLRPSGVLALDAYRTLLAGVEQNRPRFGSSQMLLERVSVLPDAAEVAAMALPPYARHVLEALLVRSGEDPEDEEVRAELNLFLRLAREALA